MTPKPEAAIPLTANDGEEIPMVGPPEDWPPPPRHVRAFPYRGRHGFAPRWVRGLLVCLALVFTGLLITSAWLHPYDEDGQPRSMATHMQLGLPACNMVEMTGKPCPSCGMTTAFSLLAHGDIKNSLKANWVGTLLAAYWFSLIPWAAISAYKGKLYFVRSGETMVTISIVTIMILMLGRWAFVLFG
ncbi:MAG: DUF2752 domain-containing protein [Gemmataceae bacterium]